ncbi:MAG: bifunctional phosphopantothenoylcysteine decarboxylase/phosphopantothenate--cysteine ligase CoaBC [Dehalococcoidia bacterium]|nr:bifunctional phosphopantothenoylcysteine decarboxylase/phosphopantothenate--cysteine ligase CoaBC [Dehalococcoidia bacterium]
MTRGKRVLLGVSGSIAAYKAVEIARELSRNGILVDVVMTEAATRFICPLTFEALLSRPVTTQLFDDASSGPIPHITLADTADVVVVAPASADTIARLAHGFADDLLCCTVLASNRPLVIAPAMHENMYLNPATQSNVAALRERGAVLVGPESGDLASGGSGIGRMADIHEIVGHTMKALGREGDLAGRRIVVTAGGTQEPLDPVRSITNRSSGKMGYALAEACRDRGADVVLVSASNSLRSPAGVEVMPVMTAQQMYEATQSAVSNASALIMAAAVADFRPATTSDEKIKKGQVGIDLHLERTVDILSSVHGEFIRVGFAAESSNLEQNAIQKMTDKKLDLIVANDITSRDSGFASDNNRVAIIDSKGGVDRLPLMTKRQVADCIVDRIVQLLP